MAFAVTVPSWHRVHRDKAGVWDRVVKNCLRKHVVSFSTFQDAGWYRQDLPATVPPISFALWADRPDGSDPKRWAASGFLAIGLRN